ncbi:uncharacterized protein EDB93DRAFT_932026 [Suillus bovinus]|uniref:uncharacterized protein n=1 Tax=Suillus bovinus TaxID=48563 RepID=UPI001B85D183|nr:uncharacterized protein EDB93DRAFT_932026 [Suillus bovinus]KAG2131708.1 hypothetical protein EDB93DRAFT_932026 [Suillus bovinus]
MSSALTYPLPVLPSIPDDLETLDSRCALPHLMALMKNTFIRGLNRVHACAPLVIVGHPTLLPFLDYVRLLLTQLNVHLEEDTTFFSANALAEVSLTEVNPDTKAIKKSVVSLLCLVSTWIMDESKFCSSALREGLSFGPALVAIMQAQIRALTPSLLSSIISHLDLLELIAASVGRISERSDMTFLLPFIVSHHDRTTSAHWPKLPKGCFEMFPTFILNHSRCWQFAPYNPLTHEAQSLIAISP